MPRYKMVFITRLCLLVLASWTSFAKGEKCSSKYYCNVTGMKYISMDTLSGYRLNTAAILVNSTKTISSCQTLCLKTKGCTSINLNITKKEDHKCHLLNKTKFEDVDLIVQDQLSIHLFIMSPCNNMPCKKSNENCVPNYTNDTYTCKRKEIRQLTGPVDKDSADYIWSFDSDSSGSVPGKSGTGFDLTTHKISLNSGKILPVPGRLTPVVYCKSASQDSALSPCMTLVQSPPCITEFQKCPSGATYSIWIKFTEEEIRSGQNAKIFNIGGAATGIMFVAAANRANGYTFRLRTEAAKTYSITFSRGITALKWTNFVVTYNPANGLCGYTNGQQRICSNTVSQMSNAVSTGKRLEFVKDAARGIFLDDFAVWTTALTSKNVADLYEKSIA